jgi:threonine-phosphate decarboxylase
MTKATSPETRPGHGGRIFEISERLRANWADIVDFSVNLNPMGPPPELEGFLMAAAAAVAQYPEPWSRALAAALGESNGIDPSLVMPGAGSTPLIYLIPRLLSPKRAVIIGPAFAEYGQALKVLGLPAAYVHAKSEEGFLLTPKVVDEALALSPDLIFVANPANPVGRLVPEECLERLAAAARAKGGPWLVIDEAFIDFCPPGLSRLPAAAKKGSKVVVLRSLTKIFCVPGLRIGYLACGDPALASAAQTLMGPWAVSTAGQMAGKRLLGLSGYLREAPARTRELRIRLEAGLEGFRITQWDKDALVVEAR